MVIKNNGRGVLVDIEELHSKMKEWPEDNETVPFEDLIKSLRDILLQGYDFKRKNKDIDFKYTGYNIGRGERRDNIEPDEMLKARSLTCEKEQGRDLLDVILLIAIRLGMEQGKREYFK